MADEKKPQHILRQRAVNKAWKRLSSLDSVDAGRFTFGFVNSSGVVHQETYPCHATMTRFASPLVVFSVYPKQAPQQLGADKRPMKRAATCAPKVREEFPEERPYIRWLISPTLSPWRSMVPTKPVYATVKKELVSVWNEDVIYKHGFLFSNLNMPANMLVNFLFATRSVFEYPYLAKLWWQLVQDNVHPSVAYWFACMQYPNDDGTYTLTNLTGHIPIYATTSHRPGFDRFVTGKPDKDKCHLPFAKHQQYRPCNIVWDQHEVLLDGDAHYYKFLAKTYPEVWEKAGVARQRKFADTYTYDPYYGKLDLRPRTYETIRDTARLEQQRVGLEFNCAELKQAA